MVQNLENMGFTVVPFGQGFKDMSPPTKELMKLTLEQKNSSWWTFSSKVEYVGYHSEKYLYNIPL